MKVLFVVKKIILLISLIFSTSFFTSYTYVSHTSGSGEMK